VLGRCAPADFTPHVGTTFAADPLALELVEVKPLPVPTPPAGVHVRPEPFALLFLARVAGNLPQGTYSLTHAGLGRLDVFLVPVGRTADGALLEAVFN
jgi:hypothetical protein